MSSEQENSPASPIAAGDGRSFPVSDSATAVTPSPNGNNAPLDLPGAGFPLQTAPEATDQPPPRSYAERLIEHRAQVEKEFREVQRVCLFYAAMLVPVLVLAGLNFHRRNDDSSVPELSSAAAFYGAILAFSWLWRHELRARFAWPSAAGKKIWLLTFLTPLATLATVAFMVLTFRNLGWPVRSATDSYTSDAWPHWLVYVWISVLPAFFEEIAFRGLIFSKLQRVMTPLHAIWVSSILFGILHFNIVGLALFLIPLAWMAAWLTHRTGSLWPGMIIHFLHNAGIVTLEFFL